MSPPQSEVIDTSSLHRSLPRSAPSSSPNTQVDYHTAPPPSAVPATPPTFVQPSPDAQGSTSAAQHSPQDISTQNPLASRLGGLFMGLTQEGYGEEDIRKAFVDFLRSSQQ